MSELFDHFPGPDAAEGGPTRAERERVARRRKIRRTIVWSVVGLIVLILVLACWVGVRALLAANDLRKAVPLASQLQAQILSGNDTSAMSTLNELSDRTSRAASYTSDPVWRLFEITPGIGNDLVAVRQVAAVIDNVAQNGLAPLAKVADTVSLSSFKPVNGVVDLTPMTAAQPTIARANSAFLAADRATRAINTSGLFSPVVDAVTRLKTTVASATTVVGSVNRAVELLPPMLGAAGPRNYLLLFQNPAEARATGGITGAVALIHTDAGRVQLVQQSSSTQLPHYPVPVLPLSDETRGLYGDITGEFIQDVNLTPNFPQSALLAQEMWKRKTGLSVDGVLSVDPVTLSYLLAATGPVTLPTGDVLNANNAVSLLLSDVYAKYAKPKDQDDFFASAASSVFNTVARGTADPTILIKALARAGEEHRVYVWSAHPEEQAVLATTTIAGGLPVSTAKTRNFGLYFNDATGAKMDYYLDVKVGAGIAVCRADKRPTYRVDVTLTNTAPLDAGKSLPAYVTGGGFFGVPVGNVRTIINAYAPVGVIPSTVTQDGKVVGSQAAVDELHPVTRIALELAPGQSSTLSFQWTDSLTTPSEVAVQMTPIIHTPETKKVAIYCPGT